MKKLFIIGNWKSNKTSLEARNWLKDFQISEVQDKEIIICPSFTLLAMMHAFIQEHNMPIKLCGQDISPFPEGAYTGAINGRQIKEFASYVLIGHSERRTHFKESDELLAEKLKMAQAYQLEPIYCIPEKNASIPPGLSVVAYEPLDAISTSGAHPVPTDVANAVGKRLQEEQHVRYPLYGGSVTSENVQTYASLPHINGFLIGGASLDPQEFAQIIQNV